MTLSLAGWICSVLSFPLGSLGRVPIPSFIKHLRFHPGKPEASVPAVASRDAALVPVPAAALRPSPRWRSDQRPQSSLCTRTGYTGRLLGPLTVPGTPVRAPETCSGPPPAWSSLASRGPHPDAKRSASLSSILVAVLLGASPLLSGPFSSLTVPSNVLGNPDSSSGSSLGFLLFLFSHLTHCESAALNNPTQGPARPLSSLAEDTAPGSRLCSFLLCPHTLARAPSL